VNRRESTSPVDRGTTATTQKGHSRSARALDVLSAAGSGDWRGDMGKLKVEWVSPEELRPNPRNPRRNEKAVRAVKDSIREFGFNVPILVDDDLNIIAGHTRLKAARALKLKSVPTIRLSHLSSTQLKAFAIADNKTGELSEWEEEKLSEMLQELDIEGFDLELTGFYDQELDSLLAGLKGDSLPGAEAEREDTVPEKPTKPLTKPGDLWILGEHRLLCGDSSNEADVKRLMDGKRFDLLVTSPPYNIGKTYSKYRDDKEYREYLAFIEKVFALAYRHMKSHRYVCVNIGREATVNTSAHYAYVLEGIGYHFFRNIYWIKPFGAGKPTATLRFPFPRYYNPKLITEKIVIYTNELEGALPQEAEIMLVYDKDYVRGSRPPKSEKIPMELLSGYIGNVWYMQPETQAFQLHPTPFPVLLVELCSRFFAFEGEIIYEPFVGSGTAIIAAEKTGRRCYGMDIDPKYCDVAVKRWEEYTSSKAKRFKKGRVA